MSAAWLFYLRMYRGRFPQLALSAAFAILQAGVNLAILLLVKHTFDQVIGSDRADGLILTGLAIVLLYLASGGLELAIRQVVLRVTKYVVQQIREEILKKMFTMSRAFSTAADRGQLHTVAVQDTERVDMMSNALVGLLLPALLVGTALSVVLFSLNAFLFSLLIAIAPVLLGVSLVMGRCLRGRISAFHRSFEQFSGGIRFVLQAMDLTRLQTAEPIEIERQVRCFEELRHTSRRMAWLASAYKLAQNTTVACAAIVILIVGGRAVSRGGMTLGQLLSFYTAVALLRGHLSVVADCVPQVIEGCESLKRLHAWLTTTETQPYWGTHRIAFRGGVQLERVSFRFPDAPVLLDVSLEISPGSLVALVGANGAGKSTVANLVLGFYRPQAGRLLADGRPYDELDLSALRREFGVVTQDPIFFPGTVLENLVYGTPDAGTEEIRRACERATADHVIPDLPDGLDTRVGEGGVLLSGGQRQRIAIARALLRRPRLLILDEPTNHFDRVSARQLVANLGRLEYAPSILVISHDLDVVREAAMIYVLEAGCVAARGTFAEVGARLTVPLEAQA